MRRNRENPLPNFVEGIYPIDKPKGKTSFSLVYSLRKLTGIQKIGHAGTLDPFASGVMVLLIGKQFTRLSDQFLTQDKEYIARVHFGIETDTYDCTGKIISQSDLIPSFSQVEEALKEFQGEQTQIPPMFSAKKCSGKKLYELARKGVTVERAPVAITLSTELIAYEYPYLDLKISCSKGTYIRTIAYDLGKRLGPGAHLSELTRTRSGSYQLTDCINGSKIYELTDRTDHSSCTQTADRADDRQL